MTMAQEYDDFGEWIKENATFVKSTVKPTDDPHVWEVTHHFTTGNGGQFSRIFQGGEWFAFCSIMADTSDLWRELMEPDHA